MRMPHLEQRAPAVTAAARRVGGGSRLVARKRGAQLAKLRLDIRRRPAQLDERGARLAVW